MTSNVIAIDPGYAKDSDGCACAVFRRGVLSTWWFARPDDGPFSPASVDFKYLNVSENVVIIERPQQDGRSWGVPPEVLMRLSWDGAMLAGLYAGMLDCIVKGPRVSTWKGSVPKPVHHGRLWAVLNDEERELLGGAATLKVIEAAKQKGALDRWSKSGVLYYPRAFKMHNILDAVALGAHELGRL